MSHWAGPPRNQGPRSRTTVHTHFPHSADTFVANGTTLNELESFQSPPIDLLHARWTAAVYDRFAGMCNKILARKLIVTANVVQPMNSEEDMLQQSYMEVRDSWADGSVRNSRMHWFEERERGPVVRMVSVRGSDKAQIRRLKSRWGGF
jgi:hypothetical protein